MQKIVERILNGQFDYDKGALDLSTSRIEIALCPGEVYSGCFDVTGAPKMPLEGCIYTNDVRMSITPETFAGDLNTINFTFSAKGLEEGDVVQGDIFIVSNQGEYALPYVFTVLQQSLESSLGSIKNLFHFTNLAKSDWEEAVRLFYSKDFIKLFQGNDFKYKKIYLGLSHCYGNEQNVEEFLVSVNKKQPIEYIPERDTISLNDPSYIVEEYISVTRNGWGYTSLHVETDCDFVSFSKREITDNDFLGNYLSFPVLINPDNVHGGVNHGKIRFFNSFTSFEVKVTVTVETVTKPDLSSHLEFRRCQYDLITFYEAFRTKKITAETWIAETGHVADRMLLIDEKAHFPRLLKAQILMVEERYNEAKWILDQVEAEIEGTRDENPALWAYYLYLTTMHNREESYIDDITDEVANIYSRDTSDWRVGWLLLYLSEEFAISPSKKWLFIEQQIETGCVSPMFYVEAVNMLVANPGLLSRLDKFEMRVIRYALTNDLLNRDIINQFVYLASHEKDYSKQILDILEKCYEIDPSDICAQTICEMLIKGDRKDSKAHEWYLFAIMSEFRITRLYEFFMESLDLTANVDIPKMVYLYFSYENTLSWEYSAFLYAKVIANRNDIPDIYDAFKEQIEKFAVSKILEGRMNRDMAVIYRHVLADIILTDEMAKALSRLLFTHKISVTGNLFSKVVVYQSRECVETVYPLIDNVAYIPIYNRDFEILFEDDFTNRYYAEAEYDLEKLMVPGKLAARLLPIIHDNLQFDVYACECSSEMIEITEETRERYQNILDAPSIDAEYKSEVRGKLMQYYHDHDAIRELDAILEELSPDVLSKRERIHAMKFMIIRGMFDKVFEWIVEYGMEGVEIKDVVSLCSRLIKRNEFVYDENLKRLSASAFFRGKYDEIILRYLAEHFKGMTKDLRKLFKASENFDIELFSMCANMILQMLYTGYFVSERMDVYSRFVRGGADRNLQMAFLTKCSFDYFVKEHVMEPLVFEELSKLKVRGENLQTVCKLAYLKYYAENEECIDSTVRPILKEYLNELIGQGIYMSFFKNFVDANTPGVNKFTDKTFVEYKTEPGKKVFIHYIIEGDEETEGKYITEEMPDMYGGVHAKAFILFFGENLLYYITEVSDGEELLTESASISKSDISRDLFNSRFNEVNDIVIAKTLQDYDTVDSLLYDYHKHTYIVKKMFSLQ